MGEKKLSEKISDFLSVLEQAQKDHLWYTEEVEKANQLTQDILHQLELEDTTYHQRAHIANKLKACRTTRRTAKDKLAEIEPLVTFLETDKGKILANQLRNILGSVRKAERDTVLHTYAPRIMKDDEYHLG